MLVVVIVEPPGCVVEQVSVEQVYVERLYH